MLKKLLIIVALTLCVTPAWAQIPSTGGSSAIAPSGTAGGDLGGTYPNPTVTGGSHLGAGTVPNAALVTAPITACSGDVNAACSQVAGGSNLTGVIGKVNALGTIGSGGTATLDLSLGNIITMTVGGGAFTFAKPTNGAANVVYMLQITSTADVAGTYATGWLITSASGTISLPGTFLSGPNTAISYIYFTYDGSNYQIPSYGNLFVARLLSRIVNASTSITGPVSNTSQAVATTTGAHTSTTGAMGPTGGGILSETGGTAPTITCSGGSTGSSIAAGSTNNKGQAVTSSSASTNCTITWSATATWPQAPFCVFADGAASVTPTAVSTGACGTSTCVFDFASATSKTFNYVCL